jgi:hypothetical protein
MFISKAQFYKNLTKMNILKWIESWYQSQCDGDWEHEYGVSISNIDNPGWRIKIDLEGTILESISIPYSLTMPEDTNWYSYEIKNAVFIANGDTSKLEFLLFKFKEILDNHTSK